MSFTSFTRLGLSIASLAIVLAAAPGARAQECSSTLQCPKGFVCQVSAVPTPPPATEPSRPAPGGAPSSGASGTSGTTGATAPADLVAPPTGGWCAPAPCTKDTECGTGMVCHSEKIKSCSGGTAPAIACAPNTDCKLPPPTPEMCTESTVSACAYKWQLPCSTDTECGDGFNCMPSVIGMCSGGTGGATPTTGGTAPAMDVAAPGFAAPLPPGEPPMCTTTTSFPGYCQPKATTCTADAECPASWTCVAVATREPAPGVPAMGGGTAGTDTGTNTGGAAIAPPPPTDPTIPAPPESTTKVCQSPLGTYGGTRGDTTSGQGTDTKGGSTTGTGGPAPTPTVPPSAGGNPSGENTGTSPSAGCAVGGTPSGSPLALAAFGLLGLLIARRRK